MSQAARDAVREAQAEGLTLTRSHAVAIDSKTAKRGPPPMSRVTMECVHIKAGLRCMQAPSAVPFIVGVGPCESGSTSLFQMLATHPSIEIGNASRRGHCCYSELYYFYRPFQRAIYNLTMARLQEYFPTPFDGHSVKVLMWGEKTPSA